MEILARENTELAGASEMKQKGNDNRHLMLEKLG